MDTSFGGLASREPRPYWRSRGFVVAAFAAAAACSDDTLGIGTAPDDDLQCALDARYLADGGVGRDGIPALTDPTFVPVEPIVPENAYAKGDDRVIGLRLASGWVAIPHNIMWVHEIVNLSDGLAVTYCPLTGSAMAFSRASIGGAELGVSGLLYQANLIMYDRNQPDESLWPQMFGEARCGPRSGARLERLPVVEMTLDAWKELHPDSRMVALTSGFANWAQYARDPYGSHYDDPDNGDFLGYPIPLDDDRRPPKERVLGFPDDGSGPGPMAFPFHAMDDVGPKAVFPIQYWGREVVVFWDRMAQSAAAFEAAVGVDPASFTATDEGFVDSETGSVWAVDGSVLSGPLGETTRRLRPVAEAYVAFWGAWAAFHPGTVIVP
ncbi:MAG: DUF3179 domain-containing protein [Gemmatimonadota bacterium]|nr:DUF3179 domain-containing protein [Gemmatimonadota bacterium]